MLIDKKKLINELLLKYKLVVWKLALHKLSIIVVKASGWLQKDDG